MKDITVLIVANKANWKTWPEKIDAIKKWFSSRVNLHINLIHTEYDAVPFSRYHSMDHPGMEGFLGIEPQWYDMNISSLPAAKTSAIVLFVVPTTQWPTQNRARGWRTDNNNGPVELHLSCDENENLYYPDGRMSSAFFEYTRHEIMHALFMIFGQKDTTHFWYDQGKLESALGELSFFEEMTTKNILIEKMKQVIPLLMELLGIKKKQLEALQTEPKRRDMIKEFALAIQRHEGWFPGSRSWRNKNPGNLRWVGQLRAIGKDDKNFAIFATDEDGFAVLCQMLTNACTGKSSVYHPNMTLKEFFEVFAPSFENNSLLYAQIVAKTLGVSIDIKIKEFV